MPELPEVETVRAWLAPALKGATMKAVTFTRDDLRYPIPVARVRGAVGSHVVAVRRRAKYLLLDLQPVAGVGVETALLVHLGMSGRCWLDHQREPPPWRKHEHWRMEFERDGEPCWLRYQDPRRFGALDVVDDPEGHRLLARLGPEPLSDSWDGATLYQGTRRRKQAIKALLMDARQVVGVGNIYASEACWRAGVHPLRSATRVGRASCDRLVTGVKDVLEEAIAAGGSTLRDFVGGDQNPGYFQQRLDVYGRDGQPCNRCGTEVVKCTLLQRSTFYCPSCQRR